MNFYNQFTGETVTPTAWQQALKAGDYYIVEHPVFQVDAQVLPAPTVYGRIRSNEGCEPGFFVVKAYSQLCPDGETGLMCICEPTRLLTRQEFERARKQNWSQGMDQHE